MSVINSYFINSEPETNNNLTQNKIEYSKKSKLVSGVFTFREIDKIKIF